MRDAAENTNAESDKRQTKEEWPLRRQSPQSVM
jgi:hypothetical protein